MSWLTRCSAGACKPIWSKLIGGVDRAVDSTSSQRYQRVRDCCCPPSLIVEEGIKYIVLSSGPDCFLTSEITLKLAVSTYNIHQCIEYQSVHRRGLNKAGVYLTDDDVESHIYASSQRCGHCKGRRYSPQDRTVCRHYAGMQSWTGEEGAFYMAEQSGCQLHTHRPVKTLDEDDDI